MPLKSAASPSGAPARAARAVPAERPHRREAGAGGDEDHRLGQVLLQVEPVGTLDEDVQAVALAQRVHVVRAQPEKSRSGRPGTGAVSSPTVTWATPSP